jgi:tetratricopeptide (TPR) repeat protein
MTIHRPYLAVAVVAVLARSAGLCQGAAGDRERVGWTVLWPSALGFTPEFAAQTDAALAVLLRQRSTADVQWVQLPVEYQACCRGLPPGAPLYDAVGREWAVQFDTLVIVRLTCQAGRWEVTARSGSAWLDSGGPCRPRTTLDVCSLPIVMAESMQAAWRPRIRVTALQGARVGLRVLAVRGMSPEAVAEKCPTGSRYRVIERSASPARSSRQDFAHAFVVLDGPVSADGQAGGRLVAIPADARRLREALDGGCELPLVPVAARPGPVRVRARARETGQPVSGVQVYASQDEFSSDPRDLKGVTDGSGAVTFADETGSLWFVRLQSGPYPYDVAILNAGGTDPYEFSITPGRESGVARELDEDQVFFDRSVQQFERQLRAVDDLLKRRDFAAAQEACVKAHDALPDGQEFSERADRMYRRHLAAGAATRAELMLVQQQQTRYRARAQECLAALENRRRDAAEAGDLVARRGQAEELASQAAELERQGEIDAALARYDAAIKLLPPGHEASKNIVERRARVAERWALRGGEKQRRARDFIFGELASLTPEKASEMLDLLAQHVECAIDYRDVYALLRADRDLSLLFKATVAQAKVLGQSADAPRGERLAQTVARLDGLLRRIEAAGVE